MTRLKALLGRVTSSRPVRAYQRFGADRGTVLAGGITYAAFFSLFPALAVAFTVFGLVLGNEVELQGRVVDAVNDNFGTPIIKLQPDDAGIVSIDQLTDTGALTLTGLIGLAGLLFTGLGWLDALREGIRAMFGQPPAVGNLVGKKVRDTGVLVVLGVVVLFSAGSGVAVNAAAGWLLRQVGLDGSEPGQLLLSALSTLVLLVVDFTVLVIMFRLLAGVHLAHDDLRDGALFGAVGLGVIKLFAGVLLGNVSDNQFLAAFAVILGLLVWLNFVARIILLGASWGATTAIDRGHLLVREPTPEQEQRVASLGAATARAAAVPGPSPMYTPVVSPRAADRVSVAAGAVIGAAGMVALRTTATAVRTVVAAARRDRD